MISLLDVKTIDGKRLVVDKSNEACIPLGFLHGAEIVTCFGQKATVMGVAPAPEGSRFAGQNVLWYQIKGVAYYYAPGNLRELGFELLINTVKKEDKQ